MDHLGLNGAGCFGILGNSNVVQTFEGLGTSYRFRNRVNRNQSIRFLPVRIDTRLDVFESCIIWFEFFAFAMINIFQHLISKLSQYGSFYVGWFLEHFLCLNTGGVILIEKWRKKISLKKSYSKFSVNRNPSLISSSNDWYLVVEIN